MNTSFDISSLKKPTEFQRDRVRDALRAFRQYGHGSGGGALTWPEVREAIAVYTGKEIGVNAKRGGERLRQFVEGYKRSRHHELRFPIPQPFEVLAAFVTHPELSLLDENELRDEMPSPQAALRLAEFLVQGQDLVSTVSVSDLEGRYSFVDFGLLDRTERVDLILKPSMDGKILQVEERQRVKVKNTEPVRERVAKALEQMKFESDRASLQRSLGWAVPTPEDNLLIFMKDEGNGRNHYYISLNDVGVWQRSHEAEDVLYLLRKDFGCEHDPDDLDAGQYADVMLEHVESTMVFMRPEHEAEEYGA